MGIMGDKMQEGGMPKPPMDEQPGMEARGGNPMEEGKAPMSKDAGSDGEQATPEEQKNYEKVVLAATKIIFDDKSRDQIMKSLQSGQKPDEALATVASSIMLELDQKSGGKIPESVIFPAAMEVLDILGEVAEKSGAFQVQIDEQIMTAASQQLVLALMKEYGVDQAEVQAMIGKMDPAKVKELVASQQASAQSWAGEQPQEQPPQQGQPAPPGMPMQGAPS